MAVRQFFGSLFRALWAILTFGTRFPTRRVGESQTIVILRAVVILISRAFCLFAGLYYFVTWVIYARPGYSRSYNVVESQESKDDGSFGPPDLAFYYQQSGQIRPKTISYHGFVRYSNSTRYQYDAARFVGREDFRPTTNQTVLGLFPPNHPLTARAYAEYMQVVVDCDPVELNEWYRFYLMHPDSVARSVTADSIANMYAFRPGSTIEIRFTPLNFTFEETANLDTWDKVRQFFGFAKKVTESSYLSRTTYIPFSPAELAMYNASTTAIFVIRPDSDMYRSKEAVPLTTFKDTVAKIGGIASAVGGMIVFLFGVGTVSPWGILVQIPFFRNKVTKNLAIGYDQKNGMSRGPFTTFSTELTESELDFLGNKNGQDPATAGASKHHQEPWTYQVGEFDPALERQGYDAKLRYLKERIDELEIVLSDFYLDTEVFQDFAARQAEDPTVMARRATKSGRGVEGGGSQLVGQVGTGGFSGVSAVDPPFSSPFFYQGDKAELTRMQDDSRLGDLASSSSNNSQSSLQMMRLDSNGYDRLEDQEFTPMLGRKP